MVFYPAACDQSKYTLMKERIWINRVASELVFQASANVPDDAAERHLK